MKASLEKTFGRIFGNRSEAAAEALVQSAPVQQLLAEIDGAEVARRKALLKQLQELPALHEPGCAKANKGAEKARAAITAAQEALGKANDAHVAALGVSLSKSAVYDAERNRLTRELEESADPRIARFVWNCLQLRTGSARHASPLYSTDANGRVEVDSSRVMAALHALDKAARDAQEMLLQPLMEAEVTATLQRIASALKPKLDAIDVDVPDIGGEKPMWTIPVSNLH